MGDDLSTERTSVKTYVPEYQKSEWKRHADELDMTQSEFVRTMVQAGRRVFSTTESSNRENAVDQGSDPGGDGLETRVEAVLSEEGPLSWDALLDSLSGDLEDRLDEAMDELQANDRVRYSGRDGGYVLIDES